MIENYGQVSLNQNIRDSHRCSNGYGVYGEYHENFILVKMKRDLFFKKSILVHTFCLLHKHRV